MKSKRIAAVTAALAALMMAAAPYVGASEAGNNTEGGTGGSNTPTDNTQKYNSLTTSAYGSVDDKYADTSKETKIANISPKNFTDLIKVLEIDDDSNIPAESFTFAVSVPKDPISADKDNGTLAVKIGVGADKIRWSDYAVSEKAFSDAAAVGSGTQGASHSITYQVSDVELKSPFSDSTMTGNDAVVLLEGNSDTYFAEKKMRLDFSGCGFTEPGIYRYYIRESGASANQGITYDTGVTEEGHNTYRTVDVYVKDCSYYEEDATDTNKLNLNRNIYIDGYVMYQGMITSAPFDTAKDPHSSQNADTGLEDKKVGNSGDGFGTGYGTANGYEPVLSGTGDSVVYAIKSEGFVNRYTSYDLTFGKVVQGNQGSRDKFFAFTINLSGAPKNTVYEVDLRRADSKSGTNAATISEYQGKTNPSQIVIGPDGTASVKFYLQHDQYITIQGLGKGTKYEIIEDKEDYTSTPGIVKNLSSLDWKAGDGNEGFDALPDPLKSAPDTGTDVGIQSDVHTGFTNTLEGTIPTGVIVSVAAPAVVGIGAVAGIIALAAKRKRKEEE